MIATALAEPYNISMRVELEPLVSAHAQVQERPDGWRFELRAGESKAYRLAQVDDYHRLPRRRFLHKPPLHLQLRARASHAQLQGTWGFGLWNDPFGLSLGFGGRAWRLPVLPNAAWFFHASPQSHLAFRDALPGSGLLAATYRSPRIPSLMLASATLAAPLLALRPTSRWLRRQAARMILQDTLALQVDPTAWHEFGLRWAADAIEFEVDGKLVYRNQISPRGPLGLVLWIDNQFAFWRPDGQFGFGTLPSSESWLEIEDLRLN
jgi:hypothetical protein